MKDSERIKRGIELASLVLSTNQVCNRSKMDEIELDRLNMMVKAARGMLSETAEYNPNDDDKAFPG